MVAEKTEKLRSAVGCLPRRFSVIEVLVMLVIFVLAGRGWLPPYVNVFGPSRLPRHS